MSAVLDLITGPLGAAMGGVAAIVAVILARWQGRSQGRREGRKEAEAKAKVKDYENAADIRRRARDADGLHPDDDARGYRDN